MARELRPGFGKTAVESIARWKHGWDADTRPLIDGSLDSAGPFDRQEDTIASACKSSEGWREQQFIYTTVLLQRPQNFLEIGTNVGVSAAYIASALRAAGTNARIHTIDASPYKLRLAKQLHQHLGLDNVTYVQGLFYDVLPSVIEELNEIHM